MAFAVLMLAVLLGYQYFFKPKPANPPPASQTQSQAAQQAAQVAPTQPGSPQPSAEQAQAPAAAPAVAAALETETTVENDLYKIVLTNRGAKVKHWILKKYTDTGGKPLDMVQPQAAALFGLPLSLFTYDTNLDEELNKKALYQVTASGAQPSATGLVLAPDSLTFHYAANGLDVVKTIGFDSSYVVTVDAQVKRNGVPVRALVEWPAGLGDMEEFLPSSLTRSQVFTPSFFAWSLDGKQDSQAAAKVSGKNTLTEPYSYAAITDLYFAAVFLPDSPDRAICASLPVPRPWTRSPPSTPSAPTASPTASRSSRSSSSAGSPSSPSHSTWPCAIFTSTVFPTGVGPSSSSPSSSTCSCFPRACP
jgi:YidC/Oxa1 family membrane protein insertase